MKNVVIAEWKRQYDAGIEAGEGRTISDAQYYLILAQGAAERHKERTITIPDGYLDGDILQEVSDRMRDAGIREFILTEHKGTGILRKIAKLQEEGWEPGRVRETGRDAFGAVYGVTFTRWKTAVALS